MWWLPALALGAELRLQPSPGARVEALPSVAPGRADVLVHRNQVDLRAVAREGGDGLRAVRALDLGGDWVLTFWTMKPDEQIELVPEGAGWRVHVGPATAPTPPPALPAPSLEELEAGVPPSVCTLAPQALSPLAGPDAVWGVSARDLRPQLPVWSEAEPEAASWEIVERVRRQLYRHRPLAADASAPSSRQSTRARLIYRLGALHRDLGHAREAAYYFGAAALLHQGEDGLAQIQRAGALLRIERWEEAEDAAWAAWRFGAPEEAVLEVLGVVALARPERPLAPLGRALAAASPRPEVQLLAGLLLSREGCVREALPLLAGAEGGTTGEAQQVARLLRADALLLAGDPLGADSVLARLDDRRLRPDWRGMGHARSRLVPLLLQPANDWLHALPGLQGAAQAHTVEGAESLWLLGQIYERLGEQRSALDAYAELVGRHRKLAQGGPGRRLAALWLERSRTLLALGREFDALSLHTAVWRPSLGAALTEPGPLARLAEGYRRAGLPDRALEVLRDLHEVQGRLGLDQRTTALHVAELYVEGGRVEEALESVHWLRSAALDPDTAAAVDAVEAAAEERRGHGAAARAAWRRAARSGRLEMRARARIALLDAAEGHCEAALPELEAVLPGLLFGQPEWGAGAAVLERCRVLVGQAGEAQAPLLRRLQEEDAAQAAFEARLRARSPVNLPGGAPM